MVGGLAEHLMERGLVPPERVEDALRRQSEQGGALDTALLETGGISEAGLLQAVSDVAGVRLVNLGDFEPNYEVAHLVPPKIAESLGVAPLSVDGAALHVACCYPVPRKEIEEIGFLLNKQIELWIGLEVRVRHWVACLYGTAMPARYSALLASLEPSRAPRVDRPAPVEEMTLEDELRQSMGDAPIPLHTRKAPDGAANLWERVETTIIDPKGYEAFARASAHTTTAQAAAPKTEREFRIDEDLPVTTVMPVVIPPEALQDWSLAQARAALKGAAREREALLEVFLRYARQTFDFSAAFAVQKGNAVGWAARGEGTDADAFPKVTIPLDAPSIFRTVAVTRGSFLGPLSADPLNRQFLALMGRAPRSAFLFPLEVRGRLLALLYGDSGQKPVSQRGVSDLLLFCQDLPGAFQEVILSRKQRLQAARRAEDDDVTEPHRGAPASHWTPGTQSVGGRMGRTATVPVLMAPQDERPPPNFLMVLRRLTGPDAAARSRAMAELARSPEASARVLAQNFPGPTAWTRMPVQELPEAEELGPISGALAKLGRPAAVALAPLLDADEPDTRYFALLAAGNLACAEVVDGVLRGLFALEPDISSAARAAAAALKGVPRFDSQMKALRQELAAVDPMRRTLAARALGTLHDREAIDGLIGLTGSEDGLCAQAAADALKDITKASLGTQPRAWSTWWAEHRSQSRAQWLVAALRSDDFDIRLSAIEELSRGTHNTFGFFADAALPEREMAIARWEQALSQDPRLRRLGS